MTDKIISIKIKSNMIAYIGKSVSHSEWLSGSYGWLLIFSLFGMKLFKSNPTLGLSAQLLIF